MYQCTIVHIFANLTWWTDKILIKESVFYPLTAVQCKTYLVVKNSTGDNETIFWTRIIYKKHITIIYYVHNKRKKDKIVQSRKVKKITALLQLYKTLIFCWPNPSWCRSSQQYILIKPEEKYILLSCWSDESKKPSINSDTLTNGRMRRKY